MSFVSKDIGLPNGDPRNATGTFRNITLRKEAAGALEDINVAFRERFGRDVPVLEGMRGIDRQNFYYDRYVNRKPGWTVAAYPGTSNHGWGVAVDFGSPINSSQSEEHAWLRANAPGYGWFWAGVDFGEPWHWEYDGRNVDAPRATRYNSETPTQEDGFMADLNTAQQTDLYNSLVWPNGKQKFKIDAVLVAQSVNQAALDKKLDTIIDRQLAPNKKWTLAAETNNRLIAVEKLLKAVAEKLELDVDDILKA